MSGWQKSVANFDNTFLLSRRRLIRRLGRAKPATLQAACAALATAIGSAGLAAAACARAGVVREGVRNGGSAHPGGHRTASATRLPCRCC